MDISTVEFIRNACTYIHVIPPIWHDPLAPKSKGTTSPFSAAWFSKFSRIIPACETATPTKQFHVTASKVNPTGIPHQKFYRAKWVCSFGSYSAQFHRIQIHCLRQAQYCRLVDKPRVYGCCSASWFPRLVRSLWAAVQLCFVLGIWTKINTNTILLDTPARSVPLPQV